MDKFRPDKTPVAIIRKYGDEVEEPAGWLQCRTTTCGNVIEHMVYSHLTLPPQVKRINADLYADAEGEVHEYQHGTSKADCIQSVSRTLANLRNLVNTNCTQSSNIRWVTLTYAQPDGKPMTDVKRVYTDYKRLSTRLGRWLDKRNIPHPEYITVLEPQGSGSWHLHCIWIWEQLAPNIPKNKDMLRKLGLPEDSGNLEDMWGQGFVRINAAANCDNLGAYFSAYLADMEQSEYISCTGDSSLSAVDAGKIKTVPGEDGNSKKYIKGARLGLYPPGVNIFRTSRGIKRPEVTTSLFNHAKKILPAGTRRTYQKSTSIVVDDKTTGEPVEHTPVTKIYYNTKSK